MCVRDKLLFACICLCYQLPPCVCLCNRSGFTGGNNTPAEECVQPYAHTHSHSHTCVHARRNCAHRLFCPSARVYVVQVRCTPVGGRVESGRGCNSSLREPMKETVEAKTAEVCPPTPLPPPPSLSTSLPRYLLHSRCQAVAA